MGSNASAPVDATTSAGASSSPSPPRPRPASPPSPVGVWEVAEKGPLVLSKNGSQRLRVVTLNCWQFDYLTVNNDERALAVIQHAVETLDADVVALQEVWSPSVRRLMSNAAREAGLTHIAGGRGGLLTLSKHPFRRVWSHTFKSRGSPERLDHLDYHGSKGLLMTEVMLPVGSVAVINTHLIARYTPDGGEPGDEYLGTRSGQLMEVLLDSGVLPWATPDGGGSSMLHDGIRSRSPIILAGDFNLQPHDEELAAFTKLSGLWNATINAAFPSPTSGSALRHDGPAWVHPSLATADTHTSAFSALMPSRVPKKLDHVFVGNPVPTFDPVSGPSVASPYLVVSSTSSSLAFTGTWQRQSTDLAFTQKLASWVGNTPSDPDVLGFSDHYGVVLDCDLQSRAPPAPAPPSLTFSHEDVRDSTRALVSRMDEGLEQTTMKTGLFGGVAVLSLAGARLLRSRVHAPRLRRGVLGWGLMSCGLAILHAQEYRALVGTRDRVGQLAPPESFLHPSASSATPEGQQ